MTAAAAVAVLLPLATPAGPLVVRSDSDCPSAVQIRAALEPLVPRAHEARDEIDATTLPGGLLLRHRPAADAPAAERSIAVGPDCAARAGAAAVVIAAWLAEVPWEPLAPPAFPAPVAVVDADGPAAPLVIALGTGVVAAGPGGPTLGGRVEVGIGRGEGRLALRADLTFAEARSARLAGGAVRWSRTTLGLGPELRLGARTALVLDAGLLVARISSAGTGYDRDAEDQGFGAGAHAGARVARSFGPLDLWAGLRGLFWPFPQRVHVRAETGRTLATRTLGAGELHVAIGATLRARLGGAR